MYFNIITIHFDILFLILLKLLFLNVNLNPKMIKILIFILFHLNYQIQPKPTSKQLSQSATKLLQFSDGNPCIAKKIQFLQTNCKKYNDKEKSKLAFYFTNCLLESSKKNMIICENSEDISDCTNRLRGDSWTTYSTFYLHIDNLCYYYKSLIWQQKTQILIDSLSRTAEKTQKTLLNMIEQSSLLHNSQKQIHQQIKESLKNQKQFNVLIQKSTKNFTSILDKLTVVINQLAQNMSTTYQALKIIIKTIDYSLNKIYNLQYYLVGQYKYSLTNILFVGLMICLILIVTSNKRYMNLRGKCLIIILIYFVIDKILRWLGLDWSLIVNLIRLVLLIVVLYIFLMNKNNKNQQREQHNNYTYFIKNLELINQRLINMNHTLQKSHQDKYRTTKRQVYSAKKML